MGLEDCFSGTQGKSGWSEIEPATISSIKPEYQGPTDVIVMADNRGIFVRPGPISAIPQNADWLRHYKGVTNDVLETLYKHRGDITRDPELLYLVDTELSA